MATTEFDPNETNGSALVTASIALLVVTWVSFGLRVFTRIVLIKNFQRDDWFMLAAQIVFTVSCAFILLGVEAGLGHHNDAIKDDDLKVAALMWQALATATYILDMMLIKLSIGLFLLRFSVQRVYFYIITISLAIITIWSLVLFFWNMFQCNPVEKQWDYRIQGGTCVTAEQVVQAAYAISIMTILSDWLYALMPIPMVWRVNMTMQAKITVVVILGLGVFASVATLVRIRFLTDLENTDDILFAGTDAMVWTLIEPGVAISAASLATIRPLLRKLQIPGFNSTNHTYGSGMSGPARSRSRPGAPMPGYGPNDVTLVEVNPDPNSAKTYPTSHARPVTEEDAKALNPFQGPKEGPLNDSKSEVYVIEGHGPRSPWGHHGTHSANRSLEQIHDLEAQSQENSHMGLGSYGSRGANM
ncbi:hypothetical protein HJFPF1_06708 [Paramyrothecium foliicola]|nr:hypothetical protein HJFPF1_06708 [Paramyrothecium foliicola]